MLQERKMSIFYYLTTVTNILPAAFDRTGTKYLILSFDKHDFIILQGSNKKITSCNCRILRIFSII